MSPANLPIAAPPGMIEAIEASGVILVLRAGAWLASDPVLAEQIATTWTPPEPEPEAVPVQLTPREFMNRLSQERQLAIMQAALGNPAVLLWITQLTGAGYIDPAHPDTITGVQAIEAVGLITAEEAAALLA